VTTTPRPTTRPAPDPAAHTPVRPLWLCRTCAAPWPCGPARLALLHRYAHDRPALPHHLTAAYHEALRDLTTLNPHDGPTPADLYRRFLAWPPT